MCKELNPIIYNKTRIIINLEYEFDEDKIEDINRMTTVLEGFAKYNKNIEPNLVNKSIKGNKHYDRI